MKKRLLSVLLSVVLVFGSVDTTVFAKEVIETETQTPESVPEETVAETKVEPKSDPEIKSEEGTEQSFENNYEEETQTKEKGDSDTTEELGSIVPSEEEETDEELLAENSGTCGDNLTWSFDESTGTLTITGSGDMDNYYAYYDVPWQSYRNKIIKLEFPSGLTSIGNNAFYDCRGLSGVEFPLSLTSIGNNAFYDCRGLSGVEFPSSLTSIGDSAFYECSGLTGELKLPLGLTSIGNSVFGHCKGLTGIEFPQGLTSIGDSAFYNCRGLTGELKLPSELENIGDGAFYDCRGLTGELKLPSGLTSIGDSAFSWCSSLTGIEFPQGLTSIGDYVFQYCSGLTGELKLPPDLTSIGDSAFGWCSSLTGIEFPQGLISMGASAFGECSGLTGELKLPSSLTIIGDGAFSNCSSLTGIEFSSGLTSIGDGVFFDCSGLTGELKLPPGLRRIGDRAFYGCSGLTGVEFPLGLTSIGNMAFCQCSGLTGELKLPSGLTSMGDYAFHYCSGLTGELKLPSGLTSIGDYAFSYCSGLTGELKLPSSLTGIGDYAFQLCYGLTGVEFPLGLTSIGNYAFHCCSGLTGELKLPSGITSIGDYAFSYCSGLTGYLCIPETIKKCGDYAFKGCTDLKRDVYIQSTDIDYTGSWGEIGDSYWHHFCLTITDTDTGKNVVTLHAPKGSTTEAFANKYDYYAFEEWDGITPPGDKGDNALDINAQIPNDEFWIVIQDVGGNAITSAMFTGANGVITVKERVDWWFDKKLEHVFEDVEGLGVVKVKNMKAGASTPIRVAATFPEWLISFPVTKDFDALGGTWDTMTIDKFKNPCIAAVYVTDSRGRTVNMLYNSALFYKDEKKQYPLEIVLNYAYVDDPARYSYQLVALDDNYRETVLGSFDNSSNIYLDTAKLSMNVAMPDMFLKVFLDNSALCQAKVRATVIEKEPKIPEGTELTVGSILSVPVPKDVPILGGSTLDFDLRMPIGAHISTKATKEGTWIQIVGFYGKTLKPGDDGKWEEVDNSIDLNNFAQKVKENWLNTYDASDLSLGHKEVAGMGVNVKFAVYFEGLKTPESNNVYMDVRIIGEFKVANGVTYSTVIGPVPVYVAFEGEIKDGASAELSDFVIIVDDDFHITMPAAAEFDNELALSLALKAGVGVNKAASFYGKGNGTFKWETKLSTKAKWENTVLLILTLTMGAEVLCFKYEMPPLAEKKFQIYPENKGKARTADIPFETAMYDESNYSVMQRDYILEGEAVVARAASSNVLINGMYPDAKPKYVSYNGADYLFYLEDQTERAVEDKSTLVYRVNTGNGWSSAKAVNDDGTADFAYDVVTGSDGIYIAWQNASKSMSGVDSISAVMEQLTLSAAKLSDGNISLLDTPENEDGLAPIMVSLAADNDKVWIYWIANTENDLLNNSNGNNIIYRTKAGSTEAQKLAETDDGIMTLASGILNGEPCAAVTADTDGKPDTLEDREIYLVNSNGMTALTNNKVMDSNPQFGKLGQEQAVVYYSENNFMRSNGTTVTPIFDKEYKNISSDNFRLACDGSNAVIIWPEIYSTAETMGHSLAMTAYKDGNWTAPANAVQLDNTLVDFTVKAHDGGKAELYYTELDESGSEAITRLYEVEARQIGRAVFSGVLYDAESYVPGSALPLTVGIYNDGTCEVSDCSVIIEDSRGNTVYTRSQINAPSVGNASELEITDFIPKNETYENYQIKLLCDGNVCDIRNLDVGGAEYTITYSTKYEAVTEYDQTDEERLYVMISNDSHFKGDVKLVITGGESGEILYEHTYEGLEPGSSANYMCSLTGLWEQTQDGYIILTAQSLDRKEPYLMDNSISVFNYERMNAKVQVALDKNEAELAVGETLQLTANVQAKEGADTTLRWESRDSEYATVDQNGLVTAVKPGITEITVWTVDGSKSNCYVRVLSEEDRKSIHTITYYDDTQQIDMKPSSFKEDEAVLLLAPYKAGYDFAGWYETPDFLGSVVEWIPKGTTTDKVFYAKWAERVRQKDAAKTETSLSVEFAGTGIYTYTGAAIKPEVIVRDEGQILQQGVDYTVSYKNNTQAATSVSGMAEQGIAPYVDNDKAPMVLITGKGNYKGKKAAAMNFTISAKSLSDASIVLTCEDSMASKASKGSYADQQLAATLKDGKKSLNKAKDYIITYDYLGENGDRTPTGADKDMAAVNKPGVYTVHISARIAKDSSGRMIRSSAKNNVSNANYTGSMETFTLYVQDAAKILGKAKITLANTKGIQQGTAGITVDQVIKSIAFGSGKNAEVYETDTAEKKAAFAEKFDVTGLDTLTANAGTGYVTVTAKTGSGYFGSRRIAVKILGTPLSKAVFTQSGNSTTFTYNGTEQAPVYTIQTSGTGSAKLTEGSDYTVTYQKEKTTVSSPIEAGSYTAIYTGIGAYTGTVKKTFKIIPLDLAAAYKADKNAVTVTASSAPYNPKGAVPEEVTVTYKAAGGTALTLSAKDYSITCSGNKAVGKGSIVLNAKGNYKGTIKNIADYDIVAKSMASEDITVAVDDVFYKAGADITPKLTVYDNGVKVNAKDYTVAFSDGSVKRAGYKLPEGVEYADLDIIVTATAGKNYTQGTTATAKLHIYTKKISNATVVLEPNGTDQNYYYTGQQIKPSLQSVTYKESKNAPEIALANSETEGYLVGYGTNTKAGSASVTIYGTGKYGGSKTVKFTIYPKWMKWIFG